MYEVALSVLSCVQAGTDVHVAWIVSGPGSDAGEAVALTPGGGRMGSLLGGALDQLLVEALPGIGAEGGLVRFTSGPVESLVGGIPEGSELTVAIAPGTALPLELWEAMAARTPAGFSLELDGDRFAGVQLVDPAGASIELTSDRLSCSFFPVPRVVISGGGPIAEALSEAFSLVGWQASVITEVDAASGLMATLSPMDSVVVIGHDTETSSRALQASIQSNAGYIGSVGSKEMQELRRRWLSYRDVEWSDRVHGPAGIPIGASNPGEIAISIVAEAVSFLHARRDTGR